MGLGILSGSMSGAPKRDGRHWLVTENGWEEELVVCNFPSLAIRSGLSQEDRIHKRVMVSTNLFGRGINIELVNTVITYDMSDESESFSAA